jgi:hypothetical protein
MVSVRDAIARAGGATLGAVFAAGAFLRGGKALHPSGAVFEARLVVPGAAAAPRGASLLSRPAEHAAIVRFSRGLGLPDTFPDLFGMAIRVLDAYGEGRHQDLLLTTSTNLPVLHHIVTPTRDAQARPYTSATPFRAGGETFIVGALPCATSPRPDGADQLERLRAAAATGRLHFDLAVARPLRRFQAVGTLHVGTELPAEYDAMLFDPGSAGGGLLPVGVINGMRRISYPMAHRGGEARR